MAGEDKLKTLKDLEERFRKLNNNKQPFFLPYELRSEAIKWIKTIKKERTIIQMDPYLYVEQKQKIPFLSGQESSLMFFFNITEEDLQ